jgi:hypothetical protein
MQGTPAAVLSVVGAKTAATRGVRRQLLKQRLVETLVEHLAFGFELIGKFKPNRHIQSVNTLCNIAMNWGAWSGCSN